MDIKVFGKIVKNIRQNVLHITQDEMAVELKTSQAIISRLEKGIGAGLKTVFKLTNYLNKKNIKSHLIFFEPFSLSNLIDKTVISKHKIKAKSTKIDKQ